MIERILSFLWWLITRTILVGFIGSVIFGLIFLLVASRAQPDFVPVNETPPPIIRKVILNTPDYARPEVGTYLTFPESYLISNAQAYGEFLQHNPPGDFPYFRAIGQFWRGYSQVYGIAYRNYPYSFGSHLMIAIIGGSATIEYGIKGIYEKTIGRLAAATAFGEKTTEDVYAADVAREYGAFVATQPWFNFPFGQKFTDLWSKNDFFGPHFIRKCERKFFLSLEYGAKNIYAGFSQIVSLTAFGMDKPEIYTSVSSIPESAFLVPGVKRIRPIGDKQWIITVPHKGFTETIPLLARQGVEFIEIAGNDEIMLTVIAPEFWPYDLSEGKELFALPLLNTPGLERVAIQAPVKSLAKILRELEAQKLQIEHLYDY